MSECKHDKGWHYEGPGLLRCTLCYQMEVHINIKELRAEVSKLRKQVEVLIELHANEVKEHNKARNEIGLLEYVIGEAEVE